MPQYYRQFPDQSSPLAYELPDQRYIGAPDQQGPPQQGPYNPVLPVQGPPDSPLAEVEGLTDKYYDTYGKLRAFAQSMHKDYGIDVTSPDITQPGGGTPFKTYQRLEAELMRTANHLSNKQKEITQMRPYVATGQVTQRGDQYETQALLPEVEDALKKINGPFYNQAEADRAKERIIGPLLQQLMQRGDQNDPLVRHNIEVLKGAGTTYSKYPGLHTFQPREDAGNRAHLKALAGASREASTAKRFTALKNGFWGENEATVEPDLDNESRPSLVNRAHSGELYGKTIVSDQSSDMLGKQVNQIVDKWVRRPDGSVWLYFKKDPESGITPDAERVDNVNGADITAKFQQSNPKFGQSPTMYNAIDILGWGDKNNVGSLDEQSMYNAESPNGYNELLGARAEADKSLGKVNEEWEQVNNKLKDLKGGLFTNDGTNLTLPDGSNMTIKKHYRGDGYYIVGHGKEHLTVGEIHKILKDKGYFGNADSGKISPDEFNAKWASLKSGESLVGPDGKTYTKK